MDLARAMKDDALREVLTNHRTANFVTHEVLVGKNMVRVNSQIINQRCLPYFEI